MQARTGLGKSRQQSCSFFDQKYILLVPVDKPIGLRAQFLQLAGIGGLKPPDAVHLASALVWNIPVFHTFDRRLLDLDKKLALGDGADLSIVEPTDEVPKLDLLNWRQSGGADPGSMRSKITR